MWKYIIGTLIILWLRLSNGKIFSNKKVLRIEPKVPWYKQVRLFYSNPTKILPNLYLGSAFNAWDWCMIGKTNINVIINVTKEIDNFYQDSLGFTYYKYPIADDNNEDIHTILLNSYEQLDWHLSNGDCVLVHCYMGASRSATVIINFLMRKFNLDYVTAYSIVKEKRPEINLSELFANTLKYSNRV